MDISVLMPVYNSASTLHRSIDSIMAQDYQDFEFIIVNDFGSNDGSREIIESYMQKDSRIKLIQLSERKGIAESLNIGIRAARGKYIARMDADDYSYCNRLSTQLDYMEKHPDIVLCGTEMRMVYDGGFRRCDVLCDDASIKASMIFSCSLYHPTVFFRKDVFEKNQWFYDPKYVCEDYELWTRIEGKMANLPVVLLDYYRCAGSQSIANRTGLDQSSCQIVKKHILIKFGIMVESYDERLFWLSQVQSSKLNEIDMVQGYQLLKEIEEKNREKKEFDEKVLAKVLCKKWNSYIWNFAFVSGNNSIGLPFIDEDSDELFTSKIYNYLGTNQCNVEGKLRDKIKNLEVLRQSVLKGEKIVFGTGKLCREFFEANPNSILEIAFFCDNNPEKWDREFLGRRVLHPDYLRNENKYMIVISSKKFFFEICNKLINDYHIEDTRIVSLGCMRKR